MSCVRIVLTVRPAQNSLLINLLGTEVSLTKTDGPHTFGFSATYGVYPSRLFISRAAQRHIQTILLFDYPKGQVSERNLRTRSDPTSHVDIGATTPSSDHHISARAVDIICPPVRRYLRAVLEEMIPSRQWRSS